LEKCQEKKSRVQQWGEATSVKSPPGRLGRKWGGYRQSKEEKRKHVWYIGEIEIIGFAAKSENG